MTTKTKRNIYWLIMLIFILTACSRSPKFSAPEIDPPADLIPGYVPDGFELVGGFKIDPVDFEARIVVDDDDQRLPLQPNWFVHFNPIFSPAGNATLGVHYESKDETLLITKSSYPGGSLELWRAGYEKTDAEDCACDCECDCCRCVNIELGIGIPLPLRSAEIQEERTINGTPVVILKGYLGWIIIFVRDDYLVAVESSLSLEENLKIVDSLLK